MIVEKMEGFQRLTHSEKANLINRLLIYPAMSLSVIAHLDMGARVVMPFGGLTALLMLVAIPFIPPGLDRFMFATLAVGTFLGTTINRFKRWREFRRGVRQHSYYLGTAGCRRCLPKFLCRNRIPERFFEPLWLMAMGLFAAQVAPFAGYWMVVSAVCMAHLENQVWQREHDEDRDIVDGLVKAEVQTVVVDRFAEPAPLQSAHARKGKIATGISRDIQTQVSHKTNRKLPN